MGGGQPSPNPPLRPHTRSWLLLCSHFSCEIINFMNWIPGKFTFFPALWGGGNECYLPCITCIKFNFTTLCSTLFWQCCEFDDTEYGRAKRRKSLSLSPRHVQVETWHFNAFVFELFERVFYFLIKSPRKKSWAKSALGFKLKEAKTNCFTFFA